MIQFACPQCEADLEAPRAKAGQRMRCHECDAIVDIPRRRGVGAGLWTLFVGVWSLALVLFVALLVEGRDEEQPDTTPGPPVANNGGGGETITPPATGKNSSTGSGPTLPASANLPALIEGLRATDPEYRAECAAKLGSQKLAAQSAGPALVHCLNDKDERVRHAAMKALMEIQAAPTRDDVRELVEALTSADPETRIFCAAALGRIGPEARADATAALVEATRDRAHPALRRQAYLSLGRVTPSNRALLYPLIVAGSNDPNAGVSQAALQLLPGLAPPTASDVPALATALTARNQTVRLNAARSLLNLGPAARGAVKALDEALTKPDRQVATLAAQTLAKIGPEARVAGPNLLAAVHGGSDEQSDRLAAAAADALVALGLVTKKDVPHCITLLRDDHPRTRLRGFLLLKPLGADGIEAAPHIVQLLKSDPEESIRLEAARTLAVFAPGYADAIPALIGTIKDADGDLRLAAVATLGRYGPAAREAVPTLEGFLKNGDNKPLLGETMTALATISPTLRTATEIARIVEKADNRELRPRAFDALTKIGKPAVPVLGEQLLNNREDRELRLQAAIALGKIGPEVRGNAKVLGFLAAHASADLDNEVKQASKNAYEKINAK